MKHIGVKKVTTYYNIKTNKKPHFSARLFIYSGSFILKLSMNLVV